MADLEGRVSGSYFAPVQPGPQDITAASKPGNDLKAFGEQRASRPPKVSVMVITYNHAKYIAQALESVLMQETNFDFEINVIEDCSTD